MGTAWGFKRVNPTRKWINEERAPDKEELRVALRAPLGVSLVNADLVEKADEAEAAHWSIGRSAKLRGRQTETRLATPSSP